MPESELLKIKGIGQEAVKKLERKGITTVRQIALKPLAELEEILGEKTARKVYEQAVAMSGIGSFVPATEYEKKVIQKREFISSGCKALDELLAGGFATGDSYHLWGEYGSGKTQIAHQLSVNVQLPPEKGGLNGKAVYIDTEGTFRPDRIREMAKAAGLDPETALKNILVARVYTTDQLAVAVERLGDEEFVKKHKIKLLVVDSLVVLFRAEYYGRGMLAERQQKLLKLLMSVTPAAEMHNFAVVYTNQPQAKPDVLYGRPEQPVGGNVVKHLANKHIWLRKSKDEKRIARVEDSSWLPSGIDATFAITKEGIRDAE